MTEKSKLDELEEVLRVAADGLRQGKPRREIGTDVMAKVRKLASDVVPASSTIEAQEEKSDTRLSWEEAAQFLEGAFDLNLARGEAFKSHERWGLTAAAVRKGVVSNSEEYRNLFDNFSFNERYLTKIKEALGKGGKWLALFIPGHLDILDFWEVLFEQAHINCAREGGAINMDELRKVNPSEIPDLELHGVNLWTAQEAWKAACKNASPLQPEASRIVFTPNEMNSGGRGTSAANDILWIMANKINFTDPVVDFVRFRSQIDNALREFVESVGGNFNELAQKTYQDLLRSNLITERALESRIPDSDCITKYPLYVFPSGEILYFFWYSKNREIVLSSGVPGKLSKSAGFRIALG